MLIDTNEITNAIVFGELFRHYCFAEDGIDNKTGCYSTFELRPEFVKIEGKEAEDFVIKLFKAEMYWGEWFRAEELCNSDRLMQEEELRAFLNNIYTDGQIIISWCWTSGDGTLLISNGQKMAVNYDCKKDYTWEWIV